MYQIILGDVTPTDTFLFGLAILGVFFLLFGVFWFSWWMQRREVSLSPYTGMPLRRATTLSFSTMEKTLRFLLEMRQYDNPIFNFNKAAVCRETGRIFTNCVTWYDTIKVDWSFIQRRYSGHFVSWGSLSKEQQEGLRKVHDSLSAYQTEQSCSNPSPRMVDSKYVYIKPGPLYVEINSGVLLGWQIVPDTEIEVLVIQKPTKIITISVPEEE